MQTSEMKDDELVSILASLEKKSEHPIAHAIVNYAEERNIKIILEGETRLSFSITVYSLPLDELASLYFKISGRKIENK